VERRHAHAHAEHDVAVVRREPVVLRLERPADADLRGLMTGARDDERRPSLPVEHLEAVVDLPAEEHEPEPLLEGLLVEVGVAPVDGLLEPPVRTEGFALLRRGLRHRSPSDPLPRFERYFAASAGGAKERVAQRGAHLKMRDEAAPGPLTPASAA